MSTKIEMRPREVRRWRVVCVAFRGEERGRCRLVNVTGRFPMSSDCMREHKKTTATNGSASIVWRRKTPPRREGRHRPSGQVEPPPPPPSGKDRESERTKDPLSPNACTCPPTPQEGATCALEALGMKPRVSALWGDKSVFWCTTWTWPEFSI